MSDVRQFECGCVPSCMSEILLSLYIYPLGLILLGYRKKLGLPELSDIPTLLESDCLTCQTRQTRLLIAWVPTPFVIVVACESIILQRIENWLGPLALTSERALLLTQRQT